MFKKMSFILLGAATVFSGGSYLLDDRESHKAFAAEVERVTEEMVQVLEAKDSVVVVSDFAYLEPANEYFTFLEEEMERKELEQQKLAEEIRLAEEKKQKEIEEKLAKVEADKKAKEEAEKKAVEMAERVAKEKAEADKKAKEEAELAIKAENERKAKEEAARAKAKADAERVAKYNEAQAIKARLKKEEEAKKIAAQPKKAVAQPKKSSTPAASGNVEALAKIIHAEAKGEPYQGKVAVGAVILNRVVDGRFPNSVTGVIFQPKQFQPVTNGAYQSARPTDSDYQAAREALNGADPTGGATFFYAPSIATTKWHETLTPTGTIGGHRFFKN